MRFVIRPENFGILFEIVFSWRFINPLSCGILAIWHAHENEDELFQVIKGTLHMQFRDHTEIVKEGEIIVVPKGVEHNPTTINNEEVHVLLFEKLSTAHTGEVSHEKTQTHYPKI